MPKKNLFFGCKAKGRGAHCGIVARGQVSTMPNNNNNNNIYVYIFARGEACGHRGREKSTRPEKEGDAQV